MTSAPASAREIKVSLPPLCFIAVGHPAMENGMIDVALLANAKTVPIDPAGAGSNRPFCRRVYATSRHFDSSCCVSQIRCLFNYPREGSRHAVTSTGER
jgi:hypothetical protein